MTATLPDIHSRREAAPAPFRRCQTYEGYVALFVAMPGLEHMAAGCAMLMGRLLQEAIERDLAGKNLLLLEPPTSRGVMATMQKDTAARLKSLKASSRDSGLPLMTPENADPSNASLRFMEDVTRRLYAAEPLMSFVRHQDQFYFGFYVSNFQLAEAAVTAEIKRLGFLELSEVGHYDPEARISSTHHPKMSVAPVTPHCVEVLKSAGFLPS